MSGLRRALEARLAAGQDNALLRFSLGTACRTDGDPVRAADHLERAVAFDPDYSAAWSVLGRTRRDLGQETAAAAAWRRGIEAAERRGDVQAARQMRVFLGRLGPNRS